MLTLWNAAQWIQWLRHTREQAPSIQEQRADVQRQVQLKQLARLADERWAEKASYLDAPDKTAQPAPATLPKDPGGYVSEERGSPQGVIDTVPSTGETEASGKAANGKAEKQGKDQENPWRRQRGGLSEGWQPEAWRSGPARKRE